jgi:hypothetical protein
VIVVDVTRTGIEQYDTGMLNPAVWKQELRSNRSDLRLLGILQHVLDPVGGNHRNIVI